MVLSNALDDLQALVELCCKVPNRKIGSNDPEVPAYIDEQLPAMITSQRKKMCGWRFLPIPSTLPNYRTKPEQYISNMLGHEGRNPHSLLTKRGWIEILGSAPSPLTAALV